VELLQKHNSEIKKEIKVQSCYRLEYKGQSIKLLLKQFKESDIFLHTKGAGWPSVEADIVEGIREAFQSGPEKSLPRASREFQIPLTIVQKIVQSRLELHAYNIRILQALRPDDLIHQKEFVVDMLRRIGNIISFLDKVCCQ
jgi:hypothetical protein